MPTTTNLSLTLPDPGSESSRGTWGTTLNTAITAIDTALADATTSAAGRMSSSDKTKLDGLQQSDWNSSSGGSEILNKPTIPSGNQIIDWTSSGVGTIHSSNIPAIALTNVQEASSQSAQLALTTQEGDVVVRTDENKSYVRNAGTSGSLSDFTLLRTPTDAVSSVNGSTGTVTLTHDGFSDFVANEHIDWTGASAGTIHSTNYTDTTPNSTNVNAAGAVMHTDIPDSDTGFLKRTGSETYDVDTSTYLTGNETITVSGDVTGSGTTSISATLADSGVSAATYGSATQVPVLAVDAKGRVTSVTNTTITTSGVSEDTVVALALALG